MDQAALEIPKIYITRELEIGILQQSVLAVTVATNLICRTNPKRYTHTVTLTHTYTQTTKHTRTFITHRHAHA